MGVGGVVQYTHTRMRAHAHAHVSADNTYVQLHARARARTHAYKHARTRARTHVRTYARACGLGQDAGADAGAADEYGRAALHWAAFYGRMRVARLLVERAGPESAGVGRNDSDGDSPEYLALLAGRNDMLMCVEGGAGGRARERRRWGMGKERLCGT